MSVKSPLADLGDAPIHLLNRMFEEEVRSSFPKEINLLELTDRVVRRWFYQVFVGHESKLPIDMIDQEER